jgi:transcriptional regulator with XRE-family HTH domain
MSELWQMIETHLDHYGVTRATFARKCGTVPQTVQNWYNRPTTLPRPEHLRAVAKVIGMPYETVLNAALVDAGYRQEVVDNVVSLRRELDAAAGRDNAALADIAAELSRQLGITPPAADLPIAARIEDDDPKVTD